MTRTQTLLSILLASAIAAPALAADNATKPDDSAPDLTAVRAKIKSKQFATAIADLSALINGGVLHADAYSLLGFSYRKSGDRTNGALYYRKALDLDPGHKGALEYQGEMFVEAGDLPKAKANLAKLVLLCPSGCEERADLEKDIKEAEAKKRTK
jgi:Flp pilus assembly protein TadD